MQNGYLSNIRGKGGNICFFKYGAGAVKRDKKREKRGICSCCGKKIDTTIHHIFGGAYRRRSEKNDFVMELCFDCHRKMHDTDLGEKTKRVFQAKYEKQHSHDDFVKLMGNSWL